MSSALQLVKQLPSSVFLGASDAQNETGLGGSDPLPLDYLEFTQALPEQGFLRGAVTELSVEGGAALATSVALFACLSAQEEARRSGGETAWCAFVDGSSSLHAAGVSQTGLDLSRLLVVRPQEEALQRVAVRLAESRVFAVVVVDLMGVPGRELRPELGRFPRTVRRLSMALQGSRGALLLLTDARARRALPLPVAQRVLLSRPHSEKLKLQVVKDRRGRLGVAKVIGAPGVVTDVPGAANATGAASVLKRVS